MSNDKNPQRKFKLQNVRLSFPNLFRKGNFNGDETKYEATFILDAEKHAGVIKEITSAIRELEKEALKLKKPLGDDKLCLKDGDDFEREEYHGKFTLKASNSKRPMVIDRDKSPLTEDDNVIYAGCYVNAIVSLWVQNNQWGKRINANLYGVQFLKDGEPFGDSGVSVDEFDMFDDDDGDDFEDLM